MSDFGFGLWTGLKVFIEHNHIRPFKSLSLLSQFLKNCGLLRTQHLLSRYYAVIFVAVYFNII